MVKTDAVGALHPLVAKEKRDRIPQVSSDVGYQSLGRALVSVLHL